VKVASDELGSRKCLGTDAHPRCRVVISGCAVRYTRPDGRFFFVAYGQISAVILEKIPRRGVLNVHASLLPRWRGDVTGGRARSCGDGETESPIMKLDEQLDQGPLAS